MFERIVVGLDGSEASLAATTLAGWIAAQLRSSVRLVSVVEESAPYVSVRREEASEQAAANAYFEGIHRDAMTRLRRHGVTVESDIRFGNEARALLASAAAFEADLIAIGHAGHSGVWGTGLGATAGRLSQSAGVSVLVARTGATDVSTLLVAYDGSPDATHAMEVATRIAHASGTAAVLATTRALAAEQTANRDSSLPRGSDGTRISWRVVTIEGDPAEALLGLARADHGLLLVGARGVQHPWATGLGPVAQVTLERSATSVLIVRQGSGVATAGHLMHSRPETVTPTTPIGEVARRLLRLGAQCLPVIDAEGRPVGMLTLGDLLRRAHFGVSHSLAQVLDDEEVTRELGRLVDAEAASDTIMTRNVASVREEAVLPEMLAEMSQRNIQRLAVVDADGRLVGIVSRSDVLRALAGAADSADLSTRRAVTGRTVEEVMRRDVPVVRPDSPADEVARMVLGSDAGRVAVVDERDKLVGVIAARDLLPLATPETRSQLVEALAGRVGRLEGFLSQLNRRDDVPRAGQLMRRDVVSIGIHASLAEVLRLMVARSLKRILVVSPDGRVVGLVDRADLVHVLATQFGSTDES